MMQHLHQGAAAQQTSRKFQQLCHLNVNKRQYTVTVKQHNTAIQMFQYILVLVVIQMHRRESIRWLRHCILKFTNHVRFLLFT
ncbi:hypothetical protein D3C74_395410 [compost metagenome]